MNDILNHFESLTGLVNDFKVIVDKVGKHVYLYSETASSSTVITGGASYILNNNVPGTTPFPVTFLSSGIDIILDYMNCLTTEEICTMTHHALELVEDCNC
jgi:hypothetical protein